MSTDITDLTGGINGKREPLEQNDLSGKTIYLIISQGSSGYGNTISEIEALCPGATIVPGTSIYCEDVPDAREELLRTIRDWNSK